MKKPKTSPLFVVSRTLLASLPLSGLAYAADQTWLDGNGNNDWSTAVANWNGPLAWTDTNHAIFGGTGETVTLTTPITVGNITFNSGGYTIAGDATNFLTLGASTIDTGANNATISSRLAGTQGLIKSGAGTLTLSGVNTYTGGTTINGGTLKLDVSSRGTNTNINVGAFAVNSGSILELFSSSTSPILANGSSFSGTGSINKEGSAALTINNGASGPSSLDNFQGTLNINTGTLSLQGGLTSTVGNFGVNIASGATFDIRTDSQKVGTLTGSGTIIKSFNGFNGTFTIGADNGSGTFSGNINTANTLPLTKEGTGTQTLSGTLAYAGATNVSAGKLLINGAKTGTGAVSVGAAGTLGGTGTIAGALNVTGTLAPGASVESLATGALTMNSGSTFSYEVAANKSADLLAANGQLTLTSVTLDLSGASANLGLNTWVVGDKLTLISYNGSDITSGFSGIADNSSQIFGVNTWRFDYNDTTAGANFNSEAIATGTRFVTMTVVPEPSVALLGGLGALALLRRRRNG